LKLWRDELRGKAAGPNETRQGAKNDRRTPKASSVRMLHSSFGNRFSAAASELVKIFFQEKLRLFAIVLRLFATRFGWCFSFGQFLQKPVLQCGGPKVVES
jgi:hypothetical protein